MNYATLEAFRTIAAQMQTEPQDWQWIGKHMSQRMFGITEKRAKEYAARHGGNAMPTVCEGEYATIESLERQFGA
jgi:hypothetical protein